MTDNKGTRRNGFQPNTCIKWVRLTAEKSGAVVNSIFWSATYLRYLTPNYRERDLLKQTHTEGTWVFYLEI